MVTTQLRRGSAMDDVTTAPPAARRLRWALVAAMALAVGLAIALVVVLTRSSGDAPSARPASPVPSVSAQAEPFRWDDVGGVRVPWSAAHGPSLLTNGRASGYTRDEQGAALAAAQVLMRTSATAGSDSFLSVLSTQVTGPNAVALKANLLDQYATLHASSGVEDGAPTPGADSEIAGYQVAAYDDAAGTATVVVVVDSSELRTRGVQVSFAVSLVWASDDWRVLAPPRGDWGAVSTQFTSPIPELLPYEQIG